MSPNPITLDDMRQHIQQLVADLDVGRQPGDVLVKWSETEAQVLRAYDTGELLEIDLPVVRTAVDYAVALHEFGHVHGRYQLSPDTLVKERWAWRWAKEHALCWTTEMEREEMDSLQWYRDHL
jgi:hypothetical protein